MATTSTNLVTSLGAGSGIDIKSLAQSLVDAERTPRKDRIDAKIKQEESKISGHSALKYALSQLKTALSDFNDAKEFSSVNVSNSQSSAFSATASVSAATGRYNITVSKVAQSTRLASTAFAASDTHFNNSTAFDLKFNVGQSVKTIAVAAGKDTPADLVSTINAQTTSTGISAQLVKTSSGYNVIFSGPTGLANAMSVASAPTGLTMAATPLQTAQDAELNINGLAMTSNTNTLSDVMPGLSLELFAPTSANTPAVLDLSRQTTGIKDKLQKLVTAYNDMEDTMTLLGDRKSTDTQYGGTLAGDSLLQTVRSQVRKMLFDSVKVYPGDDSTKAALNPDVNAAWQVGISFDRYGKMTFDSAKLDSALSAHFDQVVTFFTANRNDQSVYSTLPGGMAGEAVKKLDAMLRSTGIVEEQTTAANKKITDYKEDLAKLEDRMQALLERYTKQFSAMDSLVGSMNKTRDSLKSSFDGMMAMYTNK